MYGQLPKLKTKDGLSEIEGFPVENLNPKKIAILRLPTNDELIAYISAQRTLVTDLGRGRSTERSMPTPKANERLFKAIRLDKDGDEFDEAEQERAINIITRHRFSTCERVGENYVVKMHTLFDDRGDDEELIPCTHTVRIPFEREAAEYRRTNFVQTNLPDNLVEQRFPIEPVVKLYDSIIVKVTGYRLGESGPEFISGVAVPPHHKRTVIQNVMAAIASLEPLVSPNS